MIYTLQQWEEEEKITRLSYHPHYGSCRLPCPNCKTIGFYAPREDNGGRRYRACKFCGFWQEVDGGEPYSGEPYRCIALYCDSCGIYDWTQPKEEKDFKSCERCGLKYKKFEWAIDYPDHPFWDRNRVCFNEVELDSLYKQEKLSEILQEMRKQNISFDDLKNDEQKMLDISTVISENASKNKEEHEIFSAFYIFLGFYKKDSRVCFELKHKFDLKRSINNLVDLKKAAEESTLNDFIIKSGNELRLFQLKRYRNEVSVKKIIKFIKQVLLHYGNNLGETNLLIILEPKKWYSILEEDFFERINKEINNLNLKSESQILITYNENNKYSVIIQIYPKFTRSQTPLKINYRSLLSEYEKRQKIN